MRITLNIVAVLLVLSGAIWFLQGINVLPGSFMTGHTRWAVYGSIAIAAGIALLLGINRPRKNIYKGKVRSNTGRWLWTLGSAAEWHPPVETAPPLENSETLTVRVGDYSDKWHRRCVVSPGTAWLPYVIFPPIR